MPYLTAQWWASLCYLVRQKCFYPVFISCLGGPQPTVTKAKQAAVQQLALLTDCAAIFLSNHSAE